MKRKLLLWSILLCASHYAAAAQPDIKEGLWEMTSTGQVSGVPDMQPISNTSRSCMSKKDVTDPNTLMKNNGCSVSEMNIQANSASWKMSCQQEGVSMMGSGTMNYQHESISGEMTMAMQGEGGGVTVVTSITGRYVGPCH